MSSRKTQWVLSVIFLVLGGWALVMPSMVEDLVFREDFRINSATGHLMIGCFGAQAVLTGVALLLTHFTASGFLIFGVFGSIPFFAFN